MQRAGPVSKITHTREITLVDQTMKTIKMTLWDEEVHLVNEHDHDAPVIAVKCAKVSDFGGRSLFMTHKSMVTTCYVAKAVKFKDIKYKSKTF